MPSVRRLSIFLCLLLVAVGSVSAHGGRGRTSVYVGTYWGGPWMYPYPYPWYYPQTIIVTPPEPKTYVEQKVPSDAAFWYYCRSLGGYYPGIRECPETWLRVLPEAEKR